MFGFQPQNFEIFYLFPVDFMTQNWDPLTKSHILLMHDIYYKVASFPMASSNNLHSVLDFDIDLGMIFISRLHKIDLMRYWAFTITIKLCLLEWGYQMGGSCVFITSNFISKMPLIAVTEYWRSNRANYTGWYVNWIWKTSPFQ